MKKYIIYIASCLVALSCFSSCHWLDKEPDTELTMDMVYEDYDRTMSAFAYVYSFIPNPCWGYVNTCGWETLADDITPSERWQQWGWNCIPKITGTWTPNTGWDGNYWHEMPRRIRGAYLFMQNAKALPEQNLFQEDVDLMKVECRFMACYYWWELARVYGGIAFRPDYIAPTDAPVEELYAANVPFDTIIDYLDEELLEISKLLPATQVDPQRYGRATSVMALAVRAEALLFAASPLVNGNDWYAGYTNVNGEEIFNSKYDPSKWARAAEACKLLLDTAHANGYALYKEYNDDGTLDPFSSVANMFAVNWSAGNREVLFPYTNIQGNSTEGSSYEEYTKHASSNRHGHNCGLGVYQGLVDAFFMSNGLPISDPNSGYKEEGFSDFVEKRNTKWEYGTGEPGEITAAGTYNMYCNREPRFYTTVSYHGSWSEPLQDKFDFFSGGKDNVGTHDAPQNGYLVRKRIIPTDVPKNGQWQRNRPLWVYRLGGAYLNYAEAVNEANNTTAAREEALVYLNQIRERAGVRQYALDGTANAADATKYITIADTQEKVREVVRMERRVELCCEGVRWFDIRRWKIAEELPEMTGACYGMNQYGSNAADFFKRTQYQTRVWKRQYYWMPVYIDEMEKNPNLVQAPFWN